MTQRTISLITGASYLVIFFTAIFANFFVLDAMIQNPLETVFQSSLLVRFGMLAFLVAAVFDVIVAWGLYELYPKHVFTKLSTYFRIIHATIMGVAVFALSHVFLESTDAAILAHVDTFNMMWLIGLFFFGVHLVLLTCILTVPTFIRVFLFFAGIMYMVDTGAHTLLENYDAYASIFLTLVAIPSIFGEMALTIWLLMKGGKQITI